ncbi:hypothetical protein [Salipaludibacillus aurantiacus]|uniref:DUF3899 domain-containing protein n=1 Tax=Salipaludibacillus aurantiacus TaxID=1601833 RepID=A0A1H9W6G5_9BACI|nr:hypothetical protein [Salipaludibacillus aurantiacus]SES29063.1 hypothetical protein SAMN05518684_11484 [Salipaludibacillus aurantiacus]
MKNILTGLAGGLAVAGAVALVSYFTISMNTFLLILVALGVLAFLPLIIKAFTSGKVPTPTIYGTSAPKKWTTVGTQESGQSKKSESEGPKFKHAAIAAGAGAGLLAVFFVIALVVLG